MKAKVERQPAMPPAALPADPVVGLGCEPPGRQRLAPIQTRCPSHPSPQLGMEASVLRRRSPSLEPAPPGGLVLQGKQQPPGRS